MHKGATPAPPAREGTATPAPRPVAFRALWALRLEEFELGADVAAGHRLPVVLPVVGAEEAGQRQQAVQHLRPAGPEDLATLDAIHNLASSYDQAGRKPVLAVALGASALSTVLFILAPDVGALIAAVLSFSILLAVLCLFSISRFARVVGLVSGGR